MLSYSCYLRFPRCPYSLRNVTGLGVYALLGAALVHVLLLNLSFGGSSNNSSSSSDASTFTRNQSIQYRHSQTYTYTSPSTGDTPLQSTAPIEFEASHSNNDGALPRSTSPTTFTSSTSTAGSSPTAASTTPFIEAAGKTASTVATFTFTNATTTTTATCQESTCIPFQRLHTPLQYRNWSLLFTGPGLNRDMKRDLRVDPNLPNNPSSSSSTSSSSSSHDSFPYAICEFRLQDAHNYHFPHTMQQIYRCWSWWRLHLHLHSSAVVPTLATTTTATITPSQQQKLPVLIFPRAEMPPSNAFLTGIVNALQDAIDLEMISTNKLRLASILPTNHNHKMRNDWFQHAVQPRVPNNRVDPNDLFAMQDPTRPYYAFHRAQDARDLRDTVVAQLQAQGALVAASANNHNNSSSSNAGAAPAQALRSGRTIRSSDQQPQQRPRIAILNRKTHREIMNAPELVNRLVDDNWDDDGDIPIVFFNSQTSFAQQVEFFHNTDIVISPHGAQLTGIVFLPNCGAVLEVFPSGYYLPQFFGSLALASGLGHGYVSITKTGDWETEAIEGMHDKKSRQKVRNKPLCPEIETMLSAIKQLIVEWQQCRRADDSVDRLKNIPALL